MSELVGDGHLNRSGLMVRRVLGRIRQSFFFIPSAMMVAAIALSQLAVRLDRAFDSGDVLGPFTTTVESARTILSAVSGGTITASSVVFSLTLIAAQVAGSQFSPRALGGLFDDRFQKMVIGVVVGTFTYSLLVLGQVRTSTVDGGEPFIPRLSIALALVLALASLLALLASIDHTAGRLRVGAVADDVLSATLATVRANYAERRAEASTSLIADRPAVGPVALAPALAAIDRPDGAHPLESHRQGWVTQIAVEEMVHCLPEGGHLLLEVSVGGYVCHGEPLAWVWDIGDRDPEPIARKVRRSVAIDRARSMQQDVSFGLLQLNDIAMRALSPGVNDPETAREIIPRLGAVVLDLYGRDLGPESIEVDGRRVTTPAITTVGDFVAAAFDRVRRYGAGDQTVLDTLVATVTRVGMEARRRHGPVDLGPLRRQLDRIADHGRGLGDAAEREALDEALASARRALDAGHDAPDDDREHDDRESSNEEEEEEANDAVQDDSPAPGTGTGPRADDADGYPLDVDGPRPRWSGLNHLALVTNDLDRTTRFWHGAMGAELVATVATDAFRHYFFDVGGSCVAFFEYHGADSPTVAKPAGVPDPRLAQFDHVSLDLPDERAVRDLKARLESHGTEVTDVVDHGFLRSIYFSDPNGIALEASWFSDDPTHGRARARHFADPDPVPAVTEILAGNLRPVATRLVEEPTSDVADLWSTGA